MSNNTTGAAAASLLPAVDHKNGGLQTKASISVEVAVPDEDSSSKKDTKAAKPKAERVSVFGMFRFADSKDALLLLGGAIAAVTNGASTAAFSIIIGDIFDALNSPGDERASQLALNFVWVGIGLFFAAGLQVALFTTAAERMTIRLRRAYLRAILSQDVSFFDAQNAGMLTSQVAENSIIFREALGEKLGSLFQFGSLFIAGIGVGFTFLWQLCLVILALAPLLIAAGYFMVLAISEIVTGQLESYAAAGSVAEESFSMIRTVTAFNLQREKIVKYEDKVQQAAKKSTKQGLMVGLGFGAVTFVYYISFAIAFWTGTVLVINSREDAFRKHPLADPMPAELSFCAVGQPVPAECNTAEQGANVVFETASDVCSCSLCQCGCFYSPLGSPPTTVSSCTTGGDIVLTLFAVMFGSLAIGQAMGPLNAFTNGRAAAAALYKVIDRQSAIDATSEEGLKLDVTQVRGEIAFENVAFSYPTRTEAPVFKSLNMRIPAGKRVALVGESGSGKSTCIALLERYYDPDGGRVTLDGHDLRTLNIKGLRSLIGLVSQEPILFGTSILENVRYGRPGATDEEVFQACRDANADGFIRSFPDAYETHVTSSLVSGGQKQRLAIARALLRNPPILLLDEATAALDNESERLVNEAIDKLLVSSSGARTTIVIAHRLSSIRACDRIFVMEKGSVIEEGSHEELLAVDGLYASLTKLSEGGKLGAAKQKLKEKVPDAAFPADDTTTTTSDEALNAVESKDLVDIDLEAGGKSSTAAGDASSKSQTVTEYDTLTKKDEDDHQVTVGKPKRYSVRNAFKFAWPERYYFIPALIGAFGNGVTMPVFVFLFANVVETFFFSNASAMRARSAVWCLAFFGLALVGASAVYIQNWSFYYISGQMTRRARVDVFKHILSMQVGFFDEKSNHVGALTSKLASDAALLKAAVCDRMGAAAMNTATIVSGYVIAMLGSWKVSLVVTALFPALIFAGIMEYQAMAGVAGSDSKALEEAAHTLSESVSGIRTVAAFNMQPSVELLYYTQLLGPLRKATRKGFFAGAGYGFSQAVQFFCFGLAFWYGSRLVASGEISFRQLNQALFGIFMCAFGIGNNAALTPDLAKGQSAVQSIFSLLDRKSEIDANAKQGARPSVVLGDISFENINFAYPTRPNVTVLQNFSLNIKRGQTVAFVGTSGSGKSTLVLLLERFYDPKSGTVRIDGHDVKSLDVEWLRDQMAIVSQEPALFRGSIMENIRAGKPDATDEEVIQAAKMANAHDFISAFPQGYQTDLQTSTGVSGGQKQRIAISRALIRNPKILLLDEATSALDEESQKVVQQALDSLLTETSRTTIVVAHRLSTIRNADHIVVLQHGVVVEQGSFESLTAKKGGAFESLLRAQGKLAEGGANKHE